MADLHHHHDTATVIHEDVDRDGPVTALIVFLIMAFAAFLIWLFAFSGIVFNRNGGSSETTNNNVRVEQTSNPDANTTSAPSMMPS